MIRIVVLRSRCLQKVLVRMADGHGVFIGNFLESITNPDHQIVNSIW